MINLLGELGAFGPYVFTLVFIYLGALGLYLYFNSEKEAKKLEKEKKEMSKVNKKNLKKALEHADKPGAGEAKRKKLKPATRAKAVKKEFKRGSLYTAQGKKVTDKGQMKAIKAAEKKAAKKKEK